MTRLAGGFGCFCFWHGLSGCTFEGCNRQRASGVRQQEGHGGLLTVMMQMQCVRGTGLDRIHACFLMLPVACFVDRATCM